MFKKILTVILVAIIAANGYWFYVNYYQTACSRPLKYAIGQFDDEFGLNKIKFKSLLLETETVWEKPLGRPLFIYDENAKFKINLIYDERQQRTLDEKFTRQTLAGRNQTYAEMVEDYGRLNVQYEQRVKQYEEDVRRWNAQGGAPPGEYERMQEERRNLKDMAAELNALADEINMLARQHNYEVAAYNKKFAVPQTFDQGQYDGQSINIYQFEQESDLRLVLAHEFGHA